MSDENEALIGGINFDNNYHLTGKDSPWLDYAVYVRGNVCEEISIMCQRLWLGRRYFVHNAKEKYKRIKVLKKIIVT